MPVRARGNRRLKNNNNFINDIKVLISAGLQHYLCIYLRASSQNYDIQENYYRESIVVFFCKTSKNKFYLKNRI